MLKWKDSANRDLLSGVTIISQFQFPDINEFEIEAEIEKIKQQVWLEINDGQTAFETVKIMNHVMFDLLGFQPNKSNFLCPSKFIH